MLNSLHRQAPRRIIASLLLLMAAATLGWGFDDGFLPPGSIDPTQLGAPWTATKSHAFVVWTHGENPELARGLARLAQEALVVTREHLTRPLYDDVALVAIPDDDLFEQYTGLPGRTTAAAVQAQPIVVFLNMPALQRETPTGRLATMAHELTHVYFRKHAPAHLPLWLEEGIAMLVAGSPSPPSGTLAMRKYFGALIPLKQLETRFPQDRIGRAMAYEQSQSVVSFFITRYHPLDGLKGLSEWLLDRDMGADRIERLGEAIYVDAIDRAWQREFRVQVALFALFINPTYLWSALGGLAFIAWLVVRRRRRKRWAEMDDPMEIEPAIWSDEGGPSVQARSSLWAARPDGPPRSNEPTEGNESAMENELGMADEPGSKEEERRLGEDARLGS